MTEVGYRIDRFLRLMNDRGAPDLHLAVGRPPMLRVSGAMEQIRYRIVLEATPEEGGRTLLRLSYSYAYGTVGRLAMEGYLGTVARDKVGFTVVGRLADGQPRYVGGKRGVVERNTMRYYLAIESQKESRSSRSTRF